MKTAIAIALIVLSGCTDAGWKSTWDYGDRNQITMYSGGKEVGKWTSTGVIQHSANVDGYQFVDEATSALTTVHGDTVIVNLDQKKK